MFSVAILEQHGGKITRDIKAGLGHAGMSDEITIKQAEYLADVSGSYDLFVICPMEEYARHPAESNISAKILLLPDVFPKKMIHTIAAGLVVSFGLSVKDSITLSSLAPKQAVLTLQREILCLNGVNLEQQEIPLYIPKGADANRIMAVNAALLLLGLPPERLSLPHAPEKTIV